MFFFIEGSRNVGKTYLIEKALKDEKLNLSYYKFPFYNISQQLKTDAKSLCIGKDLALLEMINQLDFDKNLIIDRGFLSTVVYNQIYRDQDPLENIKLLEYIKENFKKKICIIYIEADEEARNILGIAKVREKDNKMLDTYKIKEILSFYDVYLNLVETLPNVSVIRFLNKFNEDSVCLFKEAIKKVL